MSGVAASSYRLGKMEGGAGAGKVCTFFRQGRCRFGDACRYLHPAEEQGGLEGLDQANFPSLDDAEAGGSADSQGSLRLGKWSRDEGMQEKSLAVDVRLSLPAGAARASLANTVDFGRPERTTRPLPSKTFKMCTPRCLPRQFRSLDCRVRRGRHSRDPRRRQTTACRHHRRAFLLRRRLHWRTYAISTPRALGWLRLPSRHGPVALLRTLSRAVCVVA